MGLERMDYGRRFQQSTPRHRCVFRCHADAEDSIEHYASCPCVATFSHRYLHLRQPPTPPLQRADFILSGANQQRATDDATLVKKAIRVYATYRTYQLLSHHTPPLPTNTHYHAWVQFAKDACRDDTRTAVLLAKYNLTHTTHPHTNATYAPHEDNDGISEVEI